MINLFFLDWCELIVIIITLQENNTVWLMFHDVIIHS